MYIEPLGEVALSPPVAWSCCCQYCCLSQLPCTHTGLPQLPLVTKTALALSQSVARCHCRADYVKGTCLFFIGSMGTLSPIRLQSGPMSYSLFGYISSVRGCYSLVSPLFPQLAISQASSCWSSVLCPRLYCVSAPCTQIYDIPLHSIEFPLWFSLKFSPEDVLPTLFFFLPVIPNLAQYAIPYSVIS